MIFGALGLIFFDLVYDWANDHKQRLSEINNHIQTKWVELQLLLPHMNSLNQSVCIILLLLIIEYIHVHAIHNHSNSFYALSKNKYAIQYHKSII